MENVSSLPPDSYGNRTVFQFSVSDFHSVKPGLTKLVFVGVNRVHKSLITTENFE